MMMTTMSHGSCRDVNLVKITIDHFEGFPSATLCERDGGIVKKGGEEILF